MDIPRGVEHLDGVARASRLVHRRAAKDLESLAIERKLLGTALSALYQAATCHRKCYGGSHILEALYGRLYNLAVSAYQLAMSGLYDEALNLTRSIGEIANLISLSVADKNAFSDWLASDTKIRITKFSPAKVRKILEEQRPALLIAPADWYSEFCENYTHVTPQTRPNLHNASEQANVGPAYELRELQSVLDELSTIVASVAMIVCRYVKIDDLFDEIEIIIRENHTHDDGPAT